MGGVGFAAAAGGGELLGDGDTLAAGTTFFAGSLLEVFLLVGAAACAVVATPVNINPSAKRSAVGVSHRLYEVSKFKTIDVSGLPYTKCLKLSPFHKTWCCRYQLEVLLVASGTIEPQGQNELYDLGLRDRAETLRQS